MYRFSADCGIERVLPGGKVISGRKHLYIGGGLLTYRGRSEDEMAGRLVSMIRDVVASEWKSGFLQLRAGGVVLDGGRALILPSPPEPNMPALVALLVQGGAQYLTDEILNIEPVLRKASGLPLPLLLDSSDVSYFPELRREPIRQRSAAAGVDTVVADRFSRQKVRNTPRRPVPIQELGGRVAEAAPVGMVVFPTFELGGVTEFRSMSKAEAVFGITESVLNLHIWTDRALVAAGKLIEEAEVSRLVIGSLPEAAALLMTSVQSGVR
jgi:hypothetical protein